MSVKCLVSIMSSVHARICVHTVCSVCAVCAPPCTLPARFRCRFDMRVAATGLYGIGIYFAVNAKYSDSGYVLQNPDKSKEMFICRVTCGEHVPGNSALRRPPPKVCGAPISHM